MNGSPGSAGFPVTGKIFVHQITGRISRQDALSLLYNCQLLLQTLPAVKTELRDSGYIKYWNEETRRILSGPSDLDALTDVALLPDCSYTLHPPDCTPPETPSPASPAPAQSSNAVTPAVTPQPASTPQTSPGTSTSPVPAAAVAAPTQTRAPQALTSSPRSSSAANGPRRDATSTTPPE